MGGIVRLPHPGNQRSTFQLKQEVTGQPPLTLTLREVRAWEVGTIPAPIVAQELTPMPDPVTLPSTEVFDLYSEHAQADYQLWVASPVQGIVPMPPGPRHVLYVLDANLFFGTARGDDPAHGPSSTASCRPSSSWESPTTR